MDNKLKVDEAVRKEIQRVYELCGHNFTRTAKKLKINPESVSGWVEGRTSVYHFGTSSRLDSVALRVILYHAITSRSLNSIARDCGKATTTLSRIRKSLVRSLAE